MGFPPSIQKFQAEKYLDDILNGSNGSAAKSPPIAKLPLLNQRTVTAIEIERSKRASKARECEDRRSINDLLGIVVHRLTKNLLKVR
jgi:hypothetical protein